MVFLLLHVRTDNQTWNQASAQTDLTSCTMNPNRSRSRDGTSRNPPQRPSREHIPDMDTSYMATPRQVQSDLDSLVHLHRRVMLLILLDDLRLLAADMEVDEMDITTRAWEPELCQHEQRAIFTFTKLLTRQQARSTTVEILLQSIVEYVYNTWGITFSSQDISLAWEYPDGEHFILRPHQTINNVLVEHRPLWLSGQGGGPQPITPFRRRNSPYVMRLRCHKTPPEIPQNSSRGIRCH